MIGNRQVKAKKVDDGSDQPFGLAEGKPKQRSQRQNCKYCQRRIPRLSATRRPRRSLPRRNCVVGAPDRQTAALTQAGIICRPVGHLSLLLRDMVATCSVGLERHKTIQIELEGASYRNPTQLTNHQSLQQRLMGGLLCLAATIDWIKR